MLPNHHKVMDSLHSKPMASRVIALMLNLLPLLLTAVTRRQHLQLEVTLSSNNSMDPHMASKHQLGILPSLLLPMATLSQPRVMEPVVMTALLLLLLQLRPSLMALSQGILPSLPIPDMVNRLLLLHLRVTMQTASQLVTTKVATPSLHHMDSNSLVTRVSRQATTSSRATNSRHHSSNKLLLHTLLKLLVHMDSLQQVSIVSKVDRPVTANPAITITTDRMARVEVLVTLALSLGGTRGEEMAEALEGMALTEVE